MNKPHTDLTDPTEVMIDTEDSHREIRIIREIRC